MSSRILGEITKYIGKLQRPAEFCCNPPARRRRLAKNPHRDPADRDCHALAIAVELLEARRPNVSPPVHFHPVDDGEEIVTPQTVKMYGFAQTTRHIVLRPSSKEMRDFTAPVQ